MKIFSFIVFFLILISCRKNPESATMEYALKNVLHYQDTLILKSRFEDCGEWGGHEEEMKVYRSGKEIILNYIRYSVNCSERNGSGSIIQHKESSDRLYLSDSQNRAVMDYVTALMKLKFMQQPVGNSGNRFSVENTAGDLHLSCYGSSDVLLENYNILMEELHFDKVEIHQR